MRKDFCIAIRKFSLRYAYFLFFDTKSYLADQLFIRRRVRIWFGCEYRKEGSPYVGIFCRVRKRDVPEFLAALEDLKRSMLICGYTDYEIEITGILDKMERIKEEGLEDDRENGSPCEAEQGQTA